MGSLKRYKKARASKKRFSSHKISKNTEENVQASSSTQEATAAVVVDVDKEISAEHLIVNDSINVSTSSSKLNIDNDDDDEGDGTNAEFRFIINSDLFLSLLIMLGRCPECCGAINVEHQPSQKRGFALFFHIYCEDCEWDLNYCTSKELNTDKTGRKAYDLNMRSLITFRENGLGYTGIKTFCKLMNMRPQMSKSSYENSLSDLHIAYVQTAR